MVMIKPRNVAHAMLPAQHAITCTSVLHAKRGYSTINNALAPAQLQHSSTPLTILVFLAQTVASLVVEPHQHV